jgi:hypothetical protein
VLLFNLGVVLDRLGDRGLAVECFRAAEQGFREAGNAEMANLAAGRVAGKVDPEASGGAGDTGP